MNTPSSDPKKIRATIRRYEKKLEQEKKNCGFYEDGAGLRYLVGPLYLLAGDLEGALASFEWFDREFPDDCGEPGYFLCWTLALRRAGRPEDAEKKLRQTALSNLYLVPKLLGLEIEKLDMWHGSSDEGPDYLEEIPPEYFLLWSREELDWAAGRYRDQELQGATKRYVEIYQELKTAPCGPERTALVEEASKLRD
jgi:tetratricopeptide (TPR) repeat protein